MKLIKEFTLENVKINKYYYIENDGKERFCARLIKIETGKTTIGTKYLTQLLFRNVWSTRKGLKEGHTMILREFEDFTDVRFYELESKDELMLCQL